MRKIYFLNFGIFLLLIQLNASAQVVMWTDTFITSVSPTALQVTNWNNFRAQLDTSICFTSMKISGTFDTSGQICTDPSIIKSYAAALKYGTSYTSPLTNGNVWSLCNRYSGEVWLNPPSECSGANCPFGYIIRPGIGNLNWGGVNTNTCSPPTQRMTFTFTYASASYDMSICEGDSVEIDGKFYSSAGLISYKLQTPACDSLINVNLSVDSIPDVTLNGFVNDTVCEDDVVIPFPGRFPTTGSFSGPGVVSSGFNPSRAGVGTFWIVYTYADSNGCSNSDSTQITVISCVGIESIEKNDNLMVYPNPNTGNFNIVFKDEVQGKIQVSLIDLIGQEIYNQNYVSNKNISVDVSSIPKGTYILKVNTGMKIVQQKILIH